MRQWLPNQWYQSASWLLLLAPFAWLYQLGIGLRKKAYQLGVFSSQGFDVPVIVVGNITVGGTGKTPLVIAIAQELQRAGYNPGIVSRGYHGKAKSYPCTVEFDSLSTEVGDEALEIKFDTGLPVIVAPRRSMAVKQLLATTNTNIVICDDGLQHYALQRSLEIGVLDGIRRFGNGWCLPAGPCREAQKKWNNLPIRVCNGAARVGEFAMQLQPIEFVNVLDPSQRVSLQEFAGQTVHAVTGIGNPQRFFITLSDLQIQYQKHSFPDHHQFTQTDFSELKTFPIIMTGKDAVKCRSFAGKNWWTLKVQAKCDPNLFVAIRNHATSYSGTASA